MRHTTVTKNKKVLAPDAKIPALHAELRALAYRRGPEAKLPTVRELCKSLGTSWATLSDALDQLESQNVIYRKPGSGVYVSPTIHQKSVSVICDPFFLPRTGQSPFWGLLLETFSSQARERTDINFESLGFHMVMPAGGSTAPLQDPLINMIEAGSVDGVLAIGLNQTALKWIEDHGIPLVSYAVVSPWLVENDYDMVVRAGVAALAEQGCRTIARWQPGKLVDPSEAHLFPEDPNADLFRESVEAAGVPFYPELMEGNPCFQYYADRGQTIELRQEQGNRTAMEVFGDPSRRKPDGIVITDDMMTNGALVALHKLGLRIGRDVKIATHANIGAHTLHGFEEDLTMLAIDPAEIANDMMDMLTTLMKGGTPPAPIKLVEPKVIVGAAVATGHE